MNAEDFKLAALLHLKISLHPLDENYVGLDKLTLEELNLLSATANCLVTYFQTRGENLITRALKVDLVGYDLEIRKKNGK